MESHSLFDKVTSLAVIVRKSPLHFYLQAIVGIIANLQRGELHEAIPNDAGEIGRK
jgi:hypothetical protein